MILVSSAVLPPTSTTRLISTPARLQASYNSRRTSLPALHFTPDTGLGQQPPPTASSSTPTIRTPTDNRVFEQLQSYVLRSPTNNRSSRPPMTVAPNSSAATPLSPRASLVAHPPFSFPSTTLTDSKKRELQSSDTDVDEEDLARQMDRAKLRAIDDGGRRPSLPINIPTSQTPTSTSLRAAHPLASNNVPGSSKPLPDVPSSDPGPPTAFDMNYILGERVFPNGPLPENEDADAGGPRRMSISLDSGVNAAHEWEDTFSRFVSQGDPEFFDRRANWSFQHSTSHNVRNENVGEREGGVDPLGVWECRTLGRYSVGVSDERPLSPSKSRSAGNSPSRRNSLVVRRLPSMVDAPAAHSSSQPTTPRSAAISTGGSATRIHIHKHSRAPAHSLFLGAPNPSAAARSSILLATKKVHLHLSAKKAATPGTLAGSRKGKERESDRGVISRSPTSPVSPSSSHGVSGGDSVAGASSSTARVTAVSDTPVLDFRLPSRAPPPGYIPSFVNRDILEAAEKSEAMDVDNDNEDASSSPSSPISGAPRALSSHGHGTYASDFASIPPEVRTMFLEQLRTKHSLGGRLKRALLSQPSISLSLTHSHPSAHLSSSSLSSEQQTYLAGVASATPTYQPPWMLMAPGFLKEENARKLRSLRSSLQNAGMFTPVRTGYDLAVESSSDERTDGDDARTKRHGHSRRSSRDSTTVVDFLSSASSGGSSKKGLNSLSRPFPSPKRAARDLPRSRSATVAKYSEHASSAGATGIDGEEKNRKDNGDNVILPSWNNVLEGMAPDTMCMAIPLWDFRGEQRQPLGSSANDANTSLRKRAKSVPRAVPEHERKWLLVTYVPFSDDFLGASAGARPSGPSMSANSGNETLPPRPRSRSNTSTSFHSPLGSLFFPPSRGGKKRPRKPPYVSPSAPPSPPTNPTLPLPPSIPTSPPSGTPQSPSKIIPPLRSFRVVGRILTTEELQFSGLRYPGADLADPAAAKSFGTSSTPKASRKPNREDDDNNEPPFTAIIAVCHDAHLGHIEYIPEGLDALGFCGNAPEHVKGAVTPFTFERSIGPLSDIGREVVEICWAGSLALIE